MCYEHIYQQKTIIKMKIVLPILFSCFSDSYLTKLNHGIKIINYYLRHL